MVLIRQHTTGKGISVPLATHDQPCAVWTNGRGISLPLHPMPEAAKRRGHLSTKGRFRISLWTPNGQNFRVLDHDRCFGSGLDQRALHSPLEPSTKVRVTLDARPPEAA